MRKINNPYVTPVNMVFVGANVIVFIVLSFLGDTTSGQFMFQHGAMHPQAVTEYGEYWRLFTSGFIHFGFQHLLNNMIMLVCLGSYLEHAFGKIKYLIFYIVCVLGSSLISMGWMLYSGDLAVSGGASGVIFGVIGGLLYIIIRNKGHFEDLAMPRFLIMIGLCLYYGFTATDVDNAAHIGGLVFGFVLCIFLYRKKAPGKRGNVDFS